MSTRYHIYSHIGNPVLATPQTTEHEPQPTEHENPLVSRPTVGHPCTAHAPATLFFTTTLQVRVPIRPSCRLQLSSHDLTRQFEKIYCRTAGEMPSVRHEPDTGSL